MAKRHDWESIEAEYRAGVKSVNAIAKAHGISEAAIRKRAKRDGWQRDLSKSVRSAARLKLVRETGSSGEVRTDADIIDSASDEITQVVVSHRKQITLWKGIANRLAVTLSEIELDATNHNEFSRSLNSGVDALGKLVKLERQAYSMDDTAADDAPPERSLTDDELEARIAELSRKLDG